MGFGSGLQGGLLPCLSCFENLSINECGRRAWEVGKVQIYIHHQMPAVIFFDNMALEKFLIFQLLQNGL